MKRKRLSALVLALMLALSLWGCGKTVIEPYESTPPLDFAAAFQKHDPEEIVLYAGGEAVTWRELFYEVMYYARVLSGSETIAFESWDEPCLIVADADGSHPTYGSLVLQNALTVITQYHVMHKNLTDAGAVLGKEALDAVDAVRQSAVDDNFGGDEAAFYAYLDDMFCTEALWLWFHQVDALYQYDGFTTLFGKNGADLPDADVLAYAAGDPAGNWTEYVQLKQIWLYTDDTAEDAAAAETDALAQIEAALAAAPADEAEAVFDALYAQYNENSELDVYGGSRAVYDGDVDEAVYHAALSLEDYAWTTADTGGAQVVVMRVPLEPDANVVFDPESGTMYTLRYFAAWQSYADRISGPDGWFAHATLEWAPGFEDFSLAEAFD